jgi:hypothetical protein
VKRDSGFEALLPGALVPVTLDGTQIELTDGMNLAVALTA